MPLDQPVTPGKVDWTGENPGILLKDDSDHFTAMALFFRVVWSPAGQGQVLLLYGSPDEINGTPDAPNVYLCDNIPLAVYLKENFIGKLKTFREIPAFDTLKPSPLISVEVTGDPYSDRYVETILSDQYKIELVWKDLEEAKALELTPEQVGTQEHTMFTLLVPAQQAAIIVNDHSLPGKVGKRVQAGLETTTAFLYFSETWIIPVRE